MNFNISLVAANKLFQYAESVISGAVDAQSSQSAFVEFHSELKKVCEVIPDWTKGKRNNLVIAGLGWRVSFKIASDSGRPETALIDHDTGKIYMLAGDHRAEYKAASVGGWSALFEVYSSLKDRFPHDDDFDLNL